MAPGVHLASGVALGLWGALKGCGRLGVPHTENQILQVSGHLERRLLEEAG